MPGYAPTSAPPSTLANAQNLPQPRDVAIPDFTSNTYVGFNGTLTGDISNPANMLSVWTPKETKFVLRGGYVLVVCETAAAGAVGYGTLAFFDNILAQPVLPICPYIANNTPVGWVSDIVPWHFDLGKGFKSIGKNNVLKIGGTVTIGAGVFRCTGLVWGIQEI
jgi:hypothetical protein